MEKCSRQDCPQTRRRQRWATPLVTCVPPPPRSGLCSPRASGLAVPSAQNVLALELQTAACFCSSERHLLRKPRSPRVRPSRQHPRGPVCLPRSVPHPAHPVSPDFYLCSVAGRHQAPRLSHSLPQPRCLELAVATDQADEGRGPQRPFSPAPCTQRRRPTAHPAS